MAACNLLHLAYKTCIIYLQYIEKKTA